MSDFQDELAKIMKQPLMQVMTEHILKQPRSTQEVLDSVQAEVERLLMSKQQHVSEESEPVSEAPKQRKRLRLPRY